MSPLATTGTFTAAFTAAMVSYSASPLWPAPAGAAMHRRHLDADGFKLAR